MSNVFKMRRKNNQMQFLITVLFVFFTGSVVFAQNVNTPLNDISISPNYNAVDTTPTRGASELNSNMNFILWFMGTKEDINSAKSKEKFYTKKSIMTSGRMPNHLLLKTLLKKAINNESC